MDNLPVDDSSSDEELLNETADVRETATDELFWNDAHFGEPSERMFKSLQLDGSSSAYDCFESPQCHSLDDMSTHCHQRGSKEFTLNGKSEIKDDNNDDDDDDDDDIDMEAMKNKLLSAWTNAKNG